MTGNYIAELADVLTDIKEISKTILKNSVEFFEDIADPDNSDIIDEIEDRLRSDGLAITVERDIIVSIIQLYFFEVIRDADIVRSELPKFSKMITKGSDRLYDRSDEYEFLYQVWSGDMYPETKIDGLRALYRDLLQQSASIQTDILVDGCIERIRKST